MKHFLVLIRHKASLEKVEALTAKHRSFLQHLYDDGRMLFSGPLVPRTGGVLWMRAASMEEAERVLAEDPFKINGISTHEILEFEPVKHSDQLPDSLFLFSPADRL